MPRPSITWLITDTHYFDKQMLQVCGRPEDYEFIIQKNLKYYVAKQDILIHLGDVITQNFSALALFLNEINCTSKVLIRGNHDKKTNNWYITNGFNLCCESLVIGDVALSHKPMRLLPHGARINIHGHFHNLDWKNKDPECAAYYNPILHRLLALEYTNYMPVDLKEFGHVEVG